MGVKGLNYPLQHWWPGFKSTNFQTGWCMISQYFHEGDRWNHGQKFFSNSNLSDCKLSYCPQAQWIESLQIRPEDYLTRQSYPIGEELFNMKKEGIMKKLFWYVRLNFVAITWLKTKLTTKFTCSSLFVECWMSCKPQLLQSLLNSRLSYSKGGYPPSK